MKVTILETDGAEATKMLVEDPRGLRTADLRRTRFGRMFTLATLSDETKRVRVFEEADVPRDRGLSSVQGRVRA